MVSPHHAQMVMAVLGTLGQVASTRTHAGSHRDRIMQQFALEELQAKTLLDLVDAVVTRRLDLAQQGFMAILNEYSVQARHYLDQQREYARAEIDSSDPLKRIELRKRINDIDTELRQIRLDARRLYDRMAQLMLAIGGPRLQLPMSDSTPLMLTNLSS